MTGVLVLLLAARAAAAPALNADVETKVETLLSQMTLEEKLGQLQQLDGEADGTPRPEHLALARKGLLGSVLNVRGAKNVNALQHAAAAESRLGIPLLFGFDVIHGYRTVFPIPLALASSWDPELVKSAARVAATEAEAAGVRWTFSPMVDVARDPRWGRIAEGAGEDPYLGSVMARAWVRGYQGDDPSQPGYLAACAKHWVGYGAAEGGRDYNTTEISERTLRDVYFPPFKAAVDAGALTFMSAFNDLDGVPASANPFTLTQVLRGEWQFRGFVVSDYNAVHELINQGVAADGADAARLALTAGVDMEMVSRDYAENLPKLVKSGKVPMSVVDEAVRRVLRVKVQLGLFDRPYADADRERTAMLTDANRAEARVAAGRSLVLLRNDGGVLPLSKTVGRVAVIGPLADDRAATLGSWTGDGRIDDARTILAGVRSALPAASVLASTGGAIGALTDADIADAAKTAAAADEVVLVLGETGDMSGEASGRSALDLPGRQLELAKAALAAGKPTAVVLLNGRPLTLGALLDAAPAVLEAWQPGTQGGDAVADALFGDVDPGGKLTATFPRSVGQVPIYYDHMNGGRPASAEHYTSKYIDAPWTPQFPFGWGLSYTTFTVSGLAVDPPSIAADGRADVRVYVENTGARAGDEVVQLYLRRRAASVTRPVAELKGFQRVTLAPGEKRRVDFTLGPNELAFLGRDMKFAVEPGDYEITVGTSSVGGLTARLAVGGKP
jgi:beta-glucosidase